MSGGMTTATDDASHILSTFANGVHDSITRAPTLAARPTLRFVKLRGFGIGLIGDVSLGSRAQSPVRK